MADEGLITTRGKFYEYCEHCGVTFKGQKYLDLARTGTPSRAVHSSGRNVINDYPSEKMGMFVSNESHSVELPDVYQFEFSKKVREYYGQAPPLNAYDRGPTGKLIPFSTKPDFVVLEVDLVLLVENKTEEEMKALHKKYPNRYAQKDGKWISPPLIKSAGELGFIYEIHTTAELSVNFSRWAEFLRDYYSRPLEVSVDKTKLVCAHLDQHPIALLEDLRTALAPKISVDDLNALIANGTLYVDWNAAPPSAPEIVFVFADREALYAFSSSRATHPVRDFFVEVRPGRRVEWNGAVREILNVGDDVISLDHGCDIPRDKFEYYIKIGSIGSAPGPENENPSDEEVELLGRGLPRREIERVTKEAEQVVGFIDGELDKPKGMSDRTLRRKAQNVKEALRKGVSAIVALIHKKRPGNPHPKGSSDFESHTYLEEDVKTRFGKKTSPDKWNCWAKYKRAGERENEKRKKKGLKPLMIFSFETYRLEVKRQRGEAQTRARFGSRAANQIRFWFWSLLPLTPRHGEHPFHIAHIDHTLIDLQSLTKRSSKGRTKKRKRVRNRKQPNCKDRPHGRLWWTTMVDAYSRRILAQYITYDPPSYRSCMMVIRECARRHQRLPKTLVVDNGKEFKSCYFRFLTADFKIAVKFRPPGNPRFGSIQERPFGTANKQFFHELLGNTKMMTKNLRLVVKSHNPIRLAVWNIEALAPELDKWSYQVYDMRSHAALGMSPREAFVEGLLRHGSRKENSYIAYTKEFILLTSPTTKKGTAKIIENGPYVVVNYIKYYSQSFSDPKVLGKQVEVRYDPFDVGHAWALIRNKWVECFSEHYAELHGKSERLIRLAADRINGRNKAHPIERRTVNATALAEFLTGLEQDEEVLLQALRDEESRDLRDKLSSTTLNTATEVPAKKPPKSESPATQRQRKATGTFPRQTEACEVI